MPDYKKKRHSRISPSPRPRRKKADKAQQNYDIEMSAASGRKPKRTQQNMKVDKGNKAEKIRRFRVSVAVVLIIAVAFAVLQVVMPMGVVEGVSNVISLIGTGSYPIELESTQTINVVSKGNYYYVLSNTNLYAYTNSGKELFSYVHGFENPVLKTSASRGIVFEQGGKQLLIFTHSGFKESITVEKSIFTAAISDSGTYALATGSDQYTAAVTVYNKHNKKLYEWFSAEKTVNNVAISPNGKKIAVSAFGSSGGGYISNLSILSFDSATPEYSESLENTLVYNIDSSFSRGFIAITDKTVKFVKWRNHKVTDYKTDYNASMFRAGKTQYVLVSNRESDKTDNHIAVFTKSGKLKYELQYKGIISDIAVFGGHIYCMNDSDISQLSSDGAVIKSADCGFGSVRLAVTSANSCAVITDNKIEKIKLEMEKVE